MSYLIYRENSRGEKTVIGFADSAPEAAVIADEERRIQDDDVVVKYEQENEK